MKHSGWPIVQRLDVKNESLYERNAEQVPVASLSIGLWSTGGHGFPIVSVAFLGLINVRSASLQPRHCNELNPMW